MKTKLIFNPNIPNWTTYPYTFWDNWYTDEELEKLKAYCVKEGTERAMVVSESGKAFKSNIRPCNTKFHYYNDELSWFFEKTAELIETMNDNFYQFDVWGFEGFQYTEYAQKDDRYGYHMDMITGDNVPDNLRATRKLSFVLMLSDSNEYTGGQFDFSVSEENLIVPEQKKGRVLVFPSFMLHRVNPVTSGVRKSIVIWVTGPKFK